MPAGKLQSKRGDGSDKPNVVVVDEPDRDGAPQVLRGRAEGHGGGAEVVVVPVRRGRRFTW